MLQFFKRRYREKLPLKISCHTDNSDTVKQVTFLTKIHGRDFPGGAVVMTLSFHCRGHGFEPWLRN